MWYCKSGSMSFLTPYYLPVHKYLNHSLFDPRMPSLSSGFPDVTPSKSRSTMNAVILSTLSPYNVKMQLDMSPSCHSNITLFKLPWVLHSDLVWDVPIKAIYLGKVSDLPGYVTICYRPYINFYSIFHPVQIDRLTDLVIVMRPTNPMSTNHPLTL